MKVINDDDVERKNAKKAKFVSNDRSGHDDQFCPKIIKIGAVLRYFLPLKNLEKIVKHRTVKNCYVKSY